MHAGLSGHCGRKRDTMIRPLRWVTHQATTGLKDLPRNSAWLLSKAKTAPSTMTKAAGSGIADNIRRMTATAADHPSGEQDSLDVRLKQAQAAIASAKQAERDALAEAQQVKAMADAAKAAADEGEERIRQALSDAEQEVERRMQAARAHFAQLLDNERERLTARLRSR